MSAAAQIAGGTFSESSHEYKNEKGVIVPSTTQILEGVGLTDLGSVPGDRLEHKRALGDAVHYATAIMDRNKFFKDCPELDWNTVHESTVPYIIGWEKFLKETGFIPEEVEQGGVCTVNGMQFGYTRDRVGLLPGFTDKFIVELKCAYEEEKAWKWQLAAYHKTYTAKGMLHRVAVQLKPDGTYRTFPYDQPRDWDVFYWALCLTHTKINEGLPWREM